jgi:hypothetical protein
MDLQTLQNVANQSPRYSQLILGLLVVFGG